MKNPILDHLILSTVAYYDCLAYPLTAFEIWKYLTQYADENFAFGKNEFEVQKSVDFQTEKFSLEDVVMGLKNEAVKKNIDEWRGFYFLKSRRDLVGKRIVRNKIAMRKIKHLRKVVSWLRLVPFVRMIGVTGRLAMKNVQRKSDWDVLVVLGSGRIWIGRTLITIFLQLIGKRRHGEKIQDRICLNHFITDASLEIRNQDLYAAGEYQFMFPLFGDEIFRKFRKENGWIKKYKPNYEPEEIGNFRILEDSKNSIIIRRILEFLWGWNFLEKILGRIEKKKIENNPLTNESGSCIVATDEALVFLPRPQGPDVIRNFAKKMSEFSR